MRALLRLSAIRDTLRGSLWFLPSISVVLALVAGTVLAHWRPTLGTFLDDLVFGGSAEGARSILEVVAQVMITVTALTFSLTVVALQMASAQFSPRVLRGFLTDRGNQLVLATFLGTFAYCLAVLRVVRVGQSGQDELVPELAVTVAILLAFASVGMLVYFIDHLTKQLQVETMMRGIERDTRKAAEQILGDSDRADEPGHPMPEIPDDVHVVRARRSGYLQRVDAESLARAAEQLDAVIRLRPPVGDHVTEGTTLGWLWSRERGAELSEDPDALDHVVHDHVHLGQERTMNEDVSFGIRQLVDIGVRALSTGMNDPTTAVNAIGHLSSALCSIVRYRPRDRTLMDQEGNLRAAVPQAGFDDHLREATEQLRRYGRDEPAVLLALLAMLTDVAECAVSDGQRAAVERSTGLILATARSELEPHDVSRLQAAGDRVRRALAEGRRAGSDADAA